MTEKTIHEGRNVKRLREILGIKQEALAFDLGLSQQTVSILEQKEALDKDMLEKIAKVLKVPAEAIKNYNDDTAVNIITNTFSDFKDSAVATGTANYCNFNPLDELLKSLEENKSLYEARIKDKEEMIAMLQKLMEKK